MNDPLEIIMSTAAHSHFFFVIIVLLYFSAVWFFLILFVRIQFQKTCVVQVNAAGI